MTRSLSRPQVSDDNPFSEAQFKTLKYHPSFPGQFGDQGQAKTFCRSFFRWYNAEHRHGGISMLTPRAGPLRERRSGHCRQEIRAPRSMGPLIPNASSEVCRSPKPLPEAVFINPPHPFPHHTGHCSLINPVECPIVVDRFRPDAKHERLATFERLSHGIHAFERGFRGGNSIAHPVQVTHPCAQAFHPRVRLREPLPHVRASAMAPRELLVGRREPVTTVGHFVVDRTERFDIRPTARSATA